MNYFRVHQAIVVLTHGHVLFGNPHFVASVFFFLKMMRIQWIYIGKYDFQTNP